MVSITEDLDLFNFHNFKFKRLMVIILDNTGVETETDIQTHNTVTMHCNAHHGRDMQQSAVGAQRRASNSASV